MVFGAKRKNAVGIVWIPSESPWAFKGYKNLLRFPRLLCAPGTVAVRCDQDYQENTSHGQQDERPDAKGRTKYVSHFALEKRARRSTTSPVPLPSNQMLMSVTDDDWRIARAHAAMGQCLVVGCDGGD
jgi:hypothetical protein